MYCKNCGKEINDKAVVCVHCGVPTENELRSNTNQVYDVMTGGLVAVCILLPIIGFIIGAIKQSNGAVESGGKCIKYSIYSFIAVIFIYGVVMLNRVFA